MGLMIHSLGEIPIDIEKDYFIYILDYGWEETIKSALSKNFEKMAKKASKNNSVVITGTVGTHFSDEVFSWHKIDGQPGDSILPAILITTINPQKFRLHDKYESSNKEVLLLIPCGKICKTDTEVVALIEKIFDDIESKKKLTDFEVAKILNKGENGAIIDALILQPNVSGVGIDLRKIFKYFKGNDRN